MTPPDAAGEAPAPAAHVAAAGVTLRSALAALPDFALAGAFLVTWISPYALGAEAVQYFDLTILLEFVIIHSSAAMGDAVLSRDTASRRLLTRLGFGLFYSIFVAGFGLAFETWWPLLAFWGLTLNRMLGVLIGDAPEGRERQYVRVGWRCPRCATSAAGS